jgi:luciferase family oxidoreductase group 1
MNDVKLSVLDLCPILSGETAYESLKHAVALSQFVEKLGYERYWIAEHHDMEGIGSSSPEVLIAHIAAMTRTMRIGSGGIMLPNHATYHIAEVFKTLEALFPGRIDLGLGRAPGSGSRAAHALRRSSTHLSADDFPEQLSDLLSYLNDELPLKAVPVNIAAPEVWILGSSDFGARLAAQRGLPFAFAQHFSHLSAVDVINLYKTHFRPSQVTPSPRAIMGCHIICADSDEMAEELALSSDISFIRFYQTGKSYPLPSLNEARGYSLSEMDRQQLRASFPKFVGSPDKVRRELEPYLNAGIDELMILCMIHDQGARQHSYQLVSSLFS